MSNQRTSALMGKAMLLAATLITAPVLAEVVMGNYDIPRDPEPVAPLAECQQVRQVVMLATMREAQRMTQPTTHPGQYGEGMLAYVAEIRAETGFVTTPQLKDTLTKYLAGTEKAAIIYKRTGFDPQSTNPSQLSKSDESELTDASSYGGAHSSRLDKICPK